jgi:hypothetical protein
VNFTRMNNPLRVHTGFDIQSGFCWWNSERVLRLSRNSRSGLTLIEVLIALTMTLIVLGAMMTAFQVVSKRMQSGRAVIEVSNRLRSVETILRSDLEGITVEARPYLNNLPPGFLQIIEGPRRDGDRLRANDFANSAMGDIDDVISMTVQSNRMFRGRLQNGLTIESPLAEVVWFTTWNRDIPQPGFLESVDLRRRLLLILPRSFPGYPVLGQSLNWQGVREFFRNNDVSARIEAVNQNQFNIIANTLEDLAVRKNRFGHLPAFAVSYGVSPALDLNRPDQGFPNAIHAGMLFDFSTDRDIVLTDVVGFDIKVYSPNAVVKRDSSGRYVLDPHDVGYAVGGNPQQFGAFVDLGDANLENPQVPAWFSGRPSELSFLRNENSTWPDGGIANTYDTWTPVYESDGINQDARQGGWRAERIDTFVNGLDDDDANGVDDAGERETMPPYPHPIRGIEIQIRSAEKLTKQIQQLTIRHSFLRD